MLGSKGSEKPDMTDRCLLTTIGCCKDSAGSTTSGLAMAGRGMGTEIEGGGGGGRDDYVEKDKISVEKP